MARRCIIQSNQLLTMPAKKIKTSAASVDDTKAYDNVEYMKGDAQDNFWLVAHQYKFDPCPMTLPPSYAESSMSSDDKQQSNLKRMASDASFAMPGEAAFKQQMCMVSAASLTSMPVESQDTLPDTLPDSDASSKASTLRRSNAVVWHSTVEPQLSLLQQKHQEICMELWQLKEHLHSWETDVHDRPKQRRHIMKCLDIVDVKNDDMGDLLEDLVKDTSMA